MNNLAFGNVQILYDAYGGVCSKRQRTVIWAVAPPEKHWGRGENDVTFNDVMFTNGVAKYPVPGGRGIFCFSNKNRKV